MFKMYARVYQAVIRFVSPFLGWREPVILNNYNQISEVLLKQNKNNVLLITDIGIAKIGLHNELVESLKNKGFNVTLFEKVMPNPTISVSEEALLVYKNSNSQALIGFGGGSAIDVTKIVAARVARPRKSIPKMRGILKVLKKTPLVIAIPTTSGTGSEATLASVIVDEKTSHKYAVNDPSLFPSYALLKPDLTYGLPKNITAFTGMDALTHAVEAYIGKSNTKITKRKAISAIKSIVENIVTAYNEPTNLEARSAMQIASYDAGVAFTRAYVGNVHALSHPLSAKYGIGHGETNAIILPIVLKYYGKTVYKKLAQIARLTNICIDKNDEIAAKAFYEKIISLNEQLQIKTTIEIIKDEDIPLLVKYAYKEANPLYPVPKIFSKKEMTQLYKEIRGDSNVK